MNQQQQQQHDGPDVELAASVDDDEELPSILNSQRLHQLAATRLAQTEEQHQNRRYKWNVVRDDAILERRIELDCEQRRIDLIALRKLMPEQQPHHPENENSAAEIISQASILAANARDLRAYQNRDNDSSQMFATRKSSNPQATPLEHKKAVVSKALQTSGQNSFPSTKNTLINQQPLPLLSSKNPMAAQALAELARRHLSPLSSRQHPNVRTFNKSDSYPERDSKCEPQLSPISTGSPWSGPRRPLEDDIVQEAELQPHDMSSPHTTQNNESYLVQLVHLMEGKPITQPIRNDVITMKTLAADGTDGSSLSSLENPILPKVKRQKQSEQLLLILLFIGGNVIICFATNHAERSKQLVDHGVNITREFLCQLYELRQRYNNMESFSYAREKGPVSELNYKQEPSLSTCFMENPSLECLWKPIIHSKSAMISPEMTRQLVESSDMDSSLNPMIEEPHFGKITGIEHSFHSTPTIGSGLTWASPTTAQSCFLVDMHPFQSFSSPDICCRSVTQNWDDILLLSSPEVVQRPYVEFAGKSLLDDDEDLFQMAPLMDIVGEFFRERRRAKKLKTKEMRR